jgi:hypothetical protein
MCVRVLPSSTAPNHELVVGSGEGIVLRVLPADIGVGGTPWSSIRVAEGIESQYVYTRKSETKWIVNVQFLQASKHSDTELLEVDR